MRSNISLIRLPTLLVFMFTVIPDKADITVSRPPSPQILATPLMMMMTRMVMLTIMMSTVDVNIGVIVPSISHRPTLLVSMLRDVKSEDSRIVAKAERY